MITIDQQLEGNHNRRMANEARAIKGWDALERREDAAEELIGQLCCDGETVYYINLRKATGAFTGKIKKGLRCDLIAYLVRNNYA